MARRSETASAFVGIDPSPRNTGVVVLGGDGRLLTCFDGKEAIAGRKYEDDIDRFLDQAEYVAQRLKKYSILCLAYEDYSFDSVHRAFTLAEFGGVLKSLLRKIYRQRIRLVAPMRNKKFATGYGFAEKGRMVEQAVAECEELKGRSHDICDAYFLAKYAMYDYDVRNAANVDSGNPHLRMRLEMIVH